MIEFKYCRLNTTRLICAISLLISFTCMGEYQWDPAVTRGSLSNGLDYAIYDSNKVDEPFNIRLIVNAGTVDETEREGVAHMLEHMVFHKTNAHPEGIHASLIQIGWKTGLQVNAVTRQTETQYMIRTRIDDALDLPGSLALLSQIAGYATLDNADWQRERGVVLEEWRLGNDLPSPVNQYKKAVTRNGSRYVERQSIGTKESINSATIE